MNVKIYNIYAPFWLLQGPTHLTPLFGPDWHGSVGTEFPGDICHSWSV